MKAFPRFFWLGIVLLSLPYGARLATADDPVTEVKKENPFEISLKEKSCEALIEMRAETIEALRANEKAKKEDPGLLYWKEKLERVRAQQREKDGLGSIGGLFRNFAPEWLTDIDERRLRCAEAEAEIVALVTPYHERYRELRERLEKIDQAIRIQCEREGKKEEEIIAIYGKDSFAYELFKFNQLWEKDAEK